MYYYLIQKVQSMADLPFLDLDPDPTVAGRQHGLALAPAITGNLQTYFERFAIAGSDRKTVLDESERWAGFIQTDNPDYYSEMVGIAQGANLSVAEITMLNVRYELTYSIYANEADILRGNGPAQEGCTLWGLMPDMTADRTCMIGQNWDWLAGLVGHHLHQTRPAGADPRHWKARLHRIHRSRDCRVQNGCECGRDWPVSVGPDNRTRRWPGPEKTGPCTLCRGSGRVALF